MSGSVKPRLVENPIRRRRSSTGQAETEVSIVKRMNLLSLDIKNPAQEISGAVTSVEAGSGSSVARILLRRPYRKSKGLSIVAAALHECLSLGHDYSDWTDVALNQRSTLVVQ